MILAPLKTVCFTLKFITEVSKLIYQLMSMKNLGKVFPKLLIQHTKKRQKNSIKGKKIINFNIWNRHRKNSYHDVSNTFPSSKINSVTI